jgi:hypothetical protein
MMKGIDISLKEGGKIIFFESIVDEMYDFDQFHCEYGQQYVMRPIQKYIEMIENFGFKLHN